jgi:NAD(P)-dependent dehydrogenase (short-subunit alcohol dehydrogenase family)
VDQTTLPGDAGRFRGRVVLVTGAGHGIGRAVVQRLAAEGARVVAADLDDAAAAAVVAGLGPSSEAIATVCDVHDTASVTSCVAQTLTTFGRLDVLVNVAGGSMPLAPLEEVTDEDWNAIVDLNLTGAMRCIRAALPQLRRQGSGVVVSVSSVNGLAAFGEEPYSSAKAGLVMLTRNLAVQLGPAGIRVNAVAPGTIRTRVWDGQPGGADRLRPLYPLGRVGEPEDIAAAVAFLASDEASWITGVTLPVDGGALAGPAQLMPLLA